LVLFCFVWEEKGNDPETAEATMEGSGTASKTRMGSEAVSGSFPRQFSPHEMGENL
jgi:hypothetical protein